MKQWRFRVARAMRRFIPFPIVRALVRFGPLWVRKRVWYYMCDDDEWLAAHHRFSVETEYGKFSGDSSDMISQYVYYFGFWEPVVSRLMKERLRPGQSFVDVGANVGWYALMAARTVGPTGRVIAIEPSQSNLFWLKNNIKQNGFSNVRLITEAAWSSEAELPLFQGPAYNSGASTVVASFADYKGCDQVGLVKARPLAAMLSPDEISTLRIIKIDVEGAEFEVIRGLEPVLDLAPQDLELFLELNPDEYDVEQLLKPFRQRGFRAFIIPNEYGHNYYINFSKAMRGEALKELVGVPTEQIDVLITRNKA